MGFRLFVAALTIAMSVTQAMSQTQPTVKDLLGKAQTEADKRAVEDLISKLKSRDGAKRPAVQSPPTPGAPSAAETKKAVPAAPQPTVSVSPDRPPPSTSPPAAAAPAPASPTPAPVAGPATPPRPPAPTATTPPAKAPEDLGPAPVAPSVAQPAPVPAPRQAGTAPGGSPATKAAVPPPPSAASVTRAPEVAEKMDLPRVDIEIFFDLDSAAISPVSHERLAVLGRALTDARLAGSKFIIGGHTDAFGPPAYNVDLSQRRAEAVRQFLIDNFKLAPELLVAKGYGSQAPKNRTNVFDPRNRRVQIINWTDATAGGQGK